MVIGKRFYSLIYFCLTVAGSYAIEYQPWVGDQYEFEWRNSLLNRSYSKVAEGSDLINRSSDDVFFKSSLSNALKPNFSLELEAEVAYTREQRPNFDHLSLAGRYVLSDDLAGDSATFTVGAVFTRAMHKSLKDIDSFHHGISEVEFFTSFGKELSIAGERWGSRLWGVVGFGTAIQKGSPWWRGRLAFDTRIRDVHEIGVFGHALFGLGSKKLHIHDFKGYGPIRHQSLDIGLRYAYLIPYYGNFNLEYSYRVYARNFPARAHQVLVTFFNTYGL